MPTLEQVSKELLAAMKSKDSVRVSTLRMLVSAIRYKEVDKKKTLAEGDVLEVIQSEAKRRREATLARAESADPRVKTGWPDACSGSRLST